MTGETLLSVGIDIGTTTTQLVFSRLILRNRGNAFTVPDFTIAEKEILYRSQIRFTPLLSDTRIDAAGVRQIVAEEYAAAGIRKSEVQTGAVIITGETARKENAREVLHALSGYAGDFVVATAGPALESVLAGKGSGSQSYSERHGCAVLNLDIGGGTTNLALFESGQLRDTGCLNVGGRLMKFAPDGALTYLSPVLQPHTALRVGQHPTENDLKPVIDLLVRVLEEATGIRPPSELLSAFVTDKLPKLSETPLLSFSGGVADLIDDVSRPPFLYGDLGVLLGRAIYASALCGGSYLRARETIRATVIGAGSHTTELSGSTVYYDRVRFPLKNLPVIRLNAAEEALAPKALTQCIRAKAAVFDGSPTVLALQGRKSPRFTELCALADGIAAAVPARCEEPLVIALTEDMGKALGQALTLLLPDRALICLDGVRLPDGAYLDIGAPIADGQVLPVVVKTLIL